MFSGIENNGIAPKIVKITGFLNLAGKDAKTRGNEIKTIKDKNPIKYATSL